MISVSACEQNIVLLAVTAATQLLHTGAGRYSGAPGTDFVRAESASVGARLW